MQESLEPEIFPAELTSRIFLVGARFAHHSKHSGYEGFSKYVGRRTARPFGGRWFRGPMGWIVNQSVRTMFRHPWYSPGALMTEWLVRKDLRASADCLFHVLYGDYDLKLLPRFDRSSNQLIATFHQPPAQLRRHPGLKDLVRQLDAVILVSNSQTAHFDGLLPRDRIFVVPHGIDTEFFAPNPGVARDPVSIISVGSHLRDFAALADAATRVWQRFPEARFTLIGAGRDRLVTSQIEAEPRMRFAEAMSDQELRLAYQRSSVALFAFIDATASNAMLEALASGLPIVATDVGGVRDYLDEESAVLCPASDGRALADAIGMLLADPSEADRRGRAARARSLRFEYRVVARDLARVYAHLLPRSRNHLDAI